MRHVRVSLAPSDLRTTSDLGPSRRFWALSVIGLLSRGNRITLQNRRLGSDGGAVQIRDLRVVLVEALLLRDRRRWRADNPGSGNGPRRSASSWGVNALAHTNNLRSDVLLLTHR